MNYAFEQSKLMQEQAEQRTKKAEAVMSAFPKGSMGLTLDSVKATQEWKDAYLESSKSLEALRAINGFMVKHFKKELRADREAQRAAKLAA